MCAAWAPARKYIYISYEDARHEVHALGAEQRGMDLRRSLLTLLGLVAAKTDKPSSSPAASAFVDELAKGEAGIIIEVGANTGAYSDKLMRRCQKAGVKVASLTLVDPQASMRRGLQRLAEEWKGEFVPAAAAVHEGNVTFYTSRNSHVSSTVSSAAKRYGLRSATVVPTVDRTPLATWNTSSHLRLSLGS